MAVSERFCMRSKRGSARFSEVCGFCCCGQENRGPGTIKSALPAASEGSGFYSAALAAWAGSRNEDQRYSRQGCSWLRAFLTANSAMALTIHVKLSGPTE